MRTILLGAAMMASVLAASLAAQEIRPEFVQLKAEDGGRPQAVYHRIEGTQPKIGILLMHPRHEDFQHFVLAPLAKAGYGALGMSPRQGDRSGVHEELILDVAAGVKYLKSRGIERVLLIGHSGGGSLMALYESQAELPPAQRIKKTPAGDPTGLEKYDLPKADGLILLNAAEGEGLHIVHRLDPSVTDENDPFSYDPTLDMYNPDNGFRVPPEPSHYSKEFIERYRKAQQERARRLVEIAKGYIREQEYYQDLMKTPAYKQMSLQEQLMIQRRAMYEKPMTVYRSFAEPGYYDLSIDPNDRTLGHYTAPRVDGQKRSDLYDWQSGERMTAMSPRAFLSTESMISNADLWKNLTKVAIPLLVVNASADSGIWPSEGQKAFDAGASKDKEKLVIVGGEHSLAPDGPKAGKGDQREQFVNAVDRWAKKRWSH
jgi:pimeloyl-ACP methyl ester carboxylesterase